jgi:tripeptidyl-peptidase-1
VPGVTLVMPSGDDGVCAWKTDETPIAEECVKSVPSWPGSSPYVVSVGASALSDKYLPICGTRWSSFFGLAIPCSGVGEVVCQSDKGHKITSGGGFSNLYSRPWWQEKAILQYLEDTEQYPALPGFFNKDGRGYPDVSVQGALWFMQVNGTFVGMSGTSASTPLFAAILVNINDNLLAEGLPPIGFLPPLLYYLYDTHPEVFNDITVGNIACRAGHIGKKEPLSCSKHYFNATSGWDAASGLGSLNYPLFLKEVLNIARAKKTLKGFEGSLTEQKQINYATPFEDVFWMYIPTLVSLGALFFALITYYSVHKKISFSKNQVTGNYGSTSLNYAA